MRRLRQQAEADRMRRPDRLDVQLFNAGGNGRGGELVGLGQREAGADYGVFLRAGPVLDVGGGDDRAVREQFETGIAAVAAGVAVEQLDAILAGLALLDVLVGADPRDEVALGGTAQRLVTEGNHEATIFRLHTHVAVAGQSCGGIDGRAPRGALVAAEHHQAFPGVGILAQQAGEFSAVG